MRLSFKMVCAGKIYLNTMTAMRDTIHGLHYATEWMYSYSYLNDKHLASGDV